MPSSHRKANNIPQAVLEIPKEEAQEGLDDVFILLSQQEKRIEKTEKILLIQGKNSDIFNSKNLIDEEVIGYGWVTNMKRMLYRPTNTLIAVKTWDYNKDDVMLQKAKEEFADLLTWDCKYIVQVLGGVCKPNCICLFLEYMNKGSLADVLAKMQVIPECLIGIIAYQCLKGLEYIHKVQNMVYRELRPSNILINSDGDVKLAEITSISQFEIERRMQHDRYTWNWTTPLYLSPEALREDKYKQNQDVWSLGIILLECVLGVNPYQPDSSVRSAFFELVQIMITKPVLALPDSFSEELRDFISQCLIEDINLRPCVQELLKHKFIKQAESQSRELFKAWLEQV